MGKPHVSVQQLQLLIIPNNFNSGQQWWSVCPISWSRGRYLNNWPGCHAIWCGYSDSQRMSRHDFGNHLTFHLALLSGQNIPLTNTWFHELCQKLLVRFPLNLLDIHDPWSMNPDFGDAQTFPLVLQSG